MLLGAVGLLAYVIVRAILGRVGIISPILCGCLFIGGVLEVSLGIIGEYLGRIYIETKNRPIYIAKEKNIEKDEK